MRTSRVAIPVTFLFTLLGPVACSEGVSTGPVPPAPPPSPIQSVTVEITGLEITGSCDHDSIFESSGDGEFTFLLTISPTPASDLPIEIAPTPRAYGEGRHNVAGRVSFEQDVVAEPAVVVEFRGTEWDGLLGPDGQLNRKVDGAILRYGNGTFGDDPVVLTLRGDKPNCGARLTLEITSAAS